MKQNPRPELVDVSLLTSIPSVSEHLALLEQAQKECVDGIAALMEEELQRKGVTHAAAIHELKQRRTIIEFQITFLRSRLNRLKEEDAVADGMI